ncbi:histidinol-phosphate transaminase [Microbacterium sp. NPDC077663]|uniref:histidinol-phosphate transaminase n=1 Tax=Microbacterium sp. NPDC077663 TaxID=3364189 RepID=UPI0037C6ED4E
MTVKLRNDLEAIPSYRQGKAPAAADREMYKVSSNENPHAPLPSVVSAIAATAGTVNRYPETAAAQLTQRLADLFGADTSQIVLGAGSVESLSQLIRATSGPGDEVLFAWRSFEAYPMLVRAAGATPVTVPLAAGHRHDLDAMLAAITPATRLVIVCNPNNPTGTVVPDAEIRRFVQGVPSDVVVLIDEAYYQFNSDSPAPGGVDLFHEFPNVVVAHTFSKAYGLAGVRVGYALAAERITAAMRKVAVPFGVTGLAQSAALASLDAELELEQRVSGLIAGRERIAGALAAAGWTLPTSRTNFLWFPLGDDTVAAAKVFDEHGLVVRPFPGEGLRVTIAEDPANDRILTAARELAERGLTGGLFSPQQASPVLH